MENKIMYQLTNPQKSVWLTEQYFQGTPINNICGSVIIKQETDLEMLNTAINYFIKNNDSFKLRFKFVNGELLQYFTEDENYKFDILNIKDEDEMEQNAKKMCSIPFNLINSRVFDFKLFKLSSGFGGFIVNSHHIISDAATFGMIGTEIISNYIRLKNNEEIPTKTYSYKDYIISEKEYLSSSRFEKDRAYWKELYSNIPDIATIPSLKNERETTNANRLEFRFDKDLINKINAFCKNNKISTYNFLMAIYTLYIGKINNTNNFSVGTPILNRTNYAEKHTSGMYISTSLLKINTEDNPTFSEFVKNIAKNSISMMKHQKYNFQYIMEDLRKEYPDFTGLYDIVLSYQVTKATDSSLEIPYKSTWHMTPFISNSMNIHFHDNNDEGNLLIEYDYKVCKYEKEDIINLHNRILGIIAQVIDNANIKLNDIEIATQDEKNKVLYKFNSTNTDFFKNRTIVELFEEQVKKNPNNTAAVFEGKKLTYKELNEKANGFANFLISKGVNEKDNICICLNRSIELIITIYAVIKSGASYILIDTELPKERINYIVNDSRAKYCVVNNLSNNIITGNLAININKCDFSKCSKENLSKKIQSDDLCIIYTSGSTGKPKGVLLHRHGFVNLVLGFDKKIGISKYKTFLGLANISFDMFTFTLFNATLLGNTFILTNENELKNPREISKLIKQNDVEFLVSTPSIIELLLLEQGENSLANIKAFVIGGEQFTCSLYNRLRSVTNGKIYNGYGPTEITACCTIKLIESKEDITIGKPLPNVQVYICDSNMKILPDGVVGEICVAGQGVANGYLNNKELTGKAFIRNPFGDGYIYKTGDKGMYKTDGDIIYLGRFDNQIKLRGLRIELGEIENKINSFPHINTCVVIKKEDLQSREYLCAYFTANDKINIIDLRKNLEKSLPRYMVPSYFVQVESFKHTPNGKIDKKILPEPEYINTKSESILPRNNIDEKLIEILKKILKINKISINDNLFDLGCDSLVAINLCIQIKEELNIDIFAKDVLDYPTIQELSDIISKRRETEVLVIEPVSKAESYDASSAQKRIYFASKLAGNESILYNTPGGVILEGNIDTKKLEECLKTLINRHEAFRTYFELNNEKVVQKIEEKINFKLEKLENVNFEEIDTIFKDFVKPFNLSCAPLFRTKFVSFTNGKSAILMDMHHIISDGTSMAIFVEELCKLYNGDKLPEISVTYKDFSAFSNNRLKTSKLKEAEEYWLHQFEGEIPVLNMPTSNARPALQSFEGNKIHTVIDKGTTKKIELISRELGVTPYMVLLASYYILLSKYTSQDDIVVGSPIINRNLIANCPIIGMFVNTLALRSKINNDFSFKEYLLKLKENMLNAYKYQEYPFDELVNKLNIKRDTARSPLFDTMFTYQNNGYKEIDFKGIKAKYYIPDTNIAKFDLSLEVIPTASEITLSFEYACKLFNKEFIKGFAKHYINILKEVLEKIDMKISDISVLSIDEKNKIIYDFNNTKVNYPKDKTLIYLFEEQVTKTPDNIALVCEDKKLTFRELNEKSNSLAYYLRYNKKISRNDFVGIMVNRSLEMMIAIIAVLKSGGTYIPIDPTYPKNRIDYMLDNSNAKILLTQKNLKDKVNFENKILVDLDNNDVYNFQTTNLEHINKPEDLAYCIFTSGSTGNPKGVMLKHKALSNLCNYCNNYIEYLKNADYKTIVSITTVSFDIFIFETLISLQKGLKLIIANENEQTDPHLLNKLIEKYNIKIIQATPSRMQILVNNIEYIPLLNNLEYVILAGEQLPISLVNTLTKICNPTIYNGYGPSETTVFSTLTKMNNKQVTIGKPLDNTQIYILDKNLKPVPIEVPGEIFISGEGVGKGYLNNEELTSKSFIQNPYVVNALMYKTGDIGMYTESGNIVCLGRKDNQVKLRGLRIELNEIENIISKYPHIKNVVTVKQNINNREFITSYYVSDKKININELRKYISIYLPKYMVPSYFIALDSLPYTPNGKVDKKTLPVPTEVINISQETYVAPKTKIQIQLVNAWEKVLNIQPIGIYDNFFDLGGDSLLAMNLNIELLKISDKISYADIFRFPTIYEQEEKINSKDDKPLFNKIENLSDKYVEILKNTTSNEMLKTWHPKNILLTGATGFLGSHILEEFIKNEDGKIYCIVREEPNISAKNKLHQKINYYFGNKYDDLIDKRIFAVAGDTAKPKFGLNDKKFNDLIEDIDIVINSAANVAHFGNYSKFYNVNVKSVEYIINLCKKFNKKLYHISTVSVIGTKLDSSYLLYKKKRSLKKKNMNFDEGYLYKGQIIDNVYARSKFEAETCVLNAISEGMDGYILRMGHLMPRYCDGVFQENILDNDTINKIATFIKLGFIPDYLLECPIEFTPVDKAADAIYKIIIHPNGKNRVFHLYNQNSISVKKLMKILHELNYNIEVVNEKDFKDKIYSILHDEELKKVLKNILEDFDNNLHLNYANDIIIKSNFTIKYLKKTHFKWPKISNEYLIRLIELLRKVI